MSSNEPMETLRSTVKMYFPDAPAQLLDDAYAFAHRAHEGQLRSSGDPYITHPVMVAQILAEMRMDLPSIITGLLHDTVEDTKITLEDVQRSFGAEVAQLVDGVTKLSKITFRTTEEKQAENFRKMIVAMAKDIRVILVKLADRLTNMRTLEYLPPQKQKTIAQETLDIYAPIANRLGISWIKVELEDLCLRFLHPDVYYRLAQQVAKTKKEREKYIEDVCQILTEALKDYGMKAIVRGRAKHFFSIYKKMERRGVDFEQVHDIIAFRIVVDNITECYKALGVIHSMYKPIPGRIKDYIAMPKANSYQSLHTTAIGPYGERVEIQIRTEDMQLIADRGIAAHWRYKEGHVGEGRKDGIEWVTRLVEWQKDLSDPAEFLETVKIDLFAEDVFIFTPKGEVRQLPHGSTPIDFAYAIHTDVGNRCIGAKVNGRIVPLKHRLKSGDTVEIVTSSSQSPSKDWLKIAVTSRAKAKIRAFIKIQEREKATLAGRELIEKGLKSFGRTYNRVDKSGDLSKAAHALGFKAVEDMLIFVGYGRTNLDDVIEQVVPKKEIDEKRAAEQKHDLEESFLKKVFRAAKKKSDARNALTVSGLDDILIRFARCCNPLPGDSIVGFITRGRGVTVHTGNCPKAFESDPERRVEVLWKSETGGAFKNSVRIRVFALDEPGILATMTQTISALGINIAYANIRTTKDKKAICIFDIDVQNTEVLGRVLQALEAKKGVISVSRSGS